MQCAPCHFSGSIEILPIQLCPELLAEVKKLNDFFNTS